MSMIDEEIIDLYWQRDEQAISQTRQKYGRYLFTIAHNILHDPRDSEESVSDTYLRAWKSMPPHRPQALPPFLAKITRAAAIDRFRTRKRFKRQSSEYACSLSELEECIPDGTSVSQQVHAQLLAETIGRFLRDLPSLQRSVFVERYFYMDPIKDIARRHAMSESKTKSMLHRIRERLRVYLRQEGYAP